MFFETGFTATFCVVFASVSAQVTKEEAKFLFDREYVGVGFSPYVKEWVNGTIPPKNSYTVAEIKEMLRVISTRFTNITTFGMGVTEENWKEAWNSTDGDCLVAQAAAELNREHGRLLISMSQGIDGNSEAILGIEAENAISAAVNANEIFPGTVWGLMYPNGDEEISDSFRTKQGVARKLGLKMGCRIPFCGILSSFRGKQKIAIEEKLRQFDYIVCIEIIDAADVLLGPEGAVQRVAEKYEDFVTEFHRIHPSAELILGEMRWPSSGNHFLFPQHLNNPRNFYTYWRKLGEWASKRKARVQMLGAFDEPWKSVYNITDPQEPDGRFGIGAHQGWWRRADNNNISAYVEKILERETNLEGSVPTNTTNGGAVLISSILAAVFLVVFAIAGYRLKLATTKAVKYLTDTDIREFHKGSDRVVIFNSTTATQTEECFKNLPYSGEYEIRKAKMHVDENVILGQGEFGRVFKGQVEINGRLMEVAIKTTKSVESPDSTHLKNLLSELKLMIYIGKNPNIILLVGAYTKEIKNGILYIAEEYCQKGSLESLLRYKSILVENFGTVSNMTRTSTNYEDTAEGSEQEKATITISQLHDWAFQIAQGMDYLGSKKIIHADLATRNILIANDNSVRVTDFGLSRRWSEYAHYIKTSQEPLPWRWMSIESLRSHHFSTKSDVWSYGVTIWEIYSLGEVPYPGLSWNTTFVEKLTEGLRLSNPKHANNSIYKIMLHCWELNPTERPSFKNLAEYFCDQVLLSEKTGMP